MLTVGWDEQVDITGWIFSKVEREGDERIIFTRNDGKRFALEHDQNCCEIVEIESIVGELSDLERTPVLIADERTSQDTPAGYTHEYMPESQTWTFYTFRTIKGSVDIRWFGRSNGYYSESVKFHEVRR